MAENRSSCGGAETNPARKSATPYRIMSEWRKGIDLIIGECRKIVQKPATSFYLDYEMRIGDFNPKMINVEMFRQRYILRQPYPGNFHRYLSDRTREFKTAPGWYKNKLI